ncbi:helicase-associated domain-containing protein [Cellulomonas fimi]|uniref:Helicase-associated domain-containing protein n=1 Tax=Cellulomonas fimi TaxID=1708 RepID=A0A7Y0QHW0_CELFI|nr:helicase-associated domain-containing protein [Cellulomonas fimi]NMR20294.1 helicase-associated domain-containing protein [Cellulomonas fimi]
MATFSEHLRSRSDAELVALLERRPDLASPAPSTLMSLAARATSRFSLERALAGVDASVLQVLEAVVALHEVRPAVTPDDVASAVGAPVPDAVAHAETFALLWTDAGALHPSPGLGELLGPYPAGLGPALGAGRPAPPDPATLLADAPPGAREILDALTWGPPVGRLPALTSTGPRAAVDWLVARGLLVPTDAATVILPREIALALRGGRTHREPAVAEPRPTGSTHPPALVEAESARAAQEIVRLVAALVREWELAPAPVLRSGGLGVRELRRLGTRLEVDDAGAALVVELAGAAGLIIDDGAERPSFAPTLEVDDWLDAELPDRWATLATAWLTTTRAPWLVGSRDDRGELRAALDPELVRPWAPRLRRAVLEVLAGQQPGTALDADAVTAVLRWRTPRSVPPPAAVAATLREAGALGLLGAGALAEPGRAVLAAIADDSATTGSPTHRSPADALVATLPAPVDEMLVQGDLTGIVPGRPTRQLAELIERTARVESRGAAVTVRFTAESVRGALDAGHTADDLLAALAAHARGPLPQPLEYLVRDAARRHGRLRVGGALGYVRSEDPALLAGLLEDPALAHLGLTRLAPTVLAAQGTPTALLSALRDRGLAPASETPEGHVVHAGPTVRRVRASTRRRRAAGGVVIPPHAAPSGTRAGTAAETTADRLAALVPAMRRAEETAQAERATRARELAAEPPPSGHARRRPGAPGGDLGTADPVTALATLREAADAGREVWLEIVGPQGTPQGRRVRPVRVDAGRVRAIDTARDAELTVAVHRIARVTPIDPAPAQPAGTRSDAPEADAQNREGTP